MRPRAKSGLRNSISGDFFAQVAKLRAARLLWAKVVVTAGGEPSAASMPIHCRTSAFTESERDPWVNMLRVTAECTAAVLGGAQSVATAPFDSVMGPVDALAQRVARNTQVVLREESHLGAVADPAGGSWFVERLTDDLARAAWAELQSVEAAGGMIAALGSGRLVDAVGEVADTREKAIARRKTAIVGVSEFPNLREAPVEREPVTQEEIQILLKASIDSLDLGAHGEGLRALLATASDQGRQPGSLTEACLALTTGGADMYSVATVLQRGQPDFHVEPLLRWRAAELWEDLRGRSEAFPTHPVAFLANLGSIPAHTARSTWARNLLGAAGIDSGTNDGFTDAEALAAAWKESSAGLAVVCGSDDDYARLLEPAVAALKAAGCPIVLVAGRLGEREAELREAGVSDFIFVGADLLSMMARVLDSLGGQ